MGNTELTGDLILAESNNLKQTIETDLNNDENIHKSKKMRSENHANIAGEVVTNNKSSNDNKSISEVICKEIMEEKNPLKSPTGTLPLSRVKYIPPVIPPQDFMVARPIVEMKGHTAFLTFAVRPPVKISSSDDEGVTISGKDKNMSS